MAEVSFEQTSCSAQLYHQYRINDCYLCCAKTCSSRSFYEGGPAWCIHFFQSAPEFLPKPSYIR